MRLVGGRASLAGAKRVVAPDPPSGVCRWAPRDNSRWEISRRGQEPWARCCSEPLRRGSALGVRGLGRTVAGGDRSATGNWPSRWDPGALLCRAGTAGRDAPQADSRHLDCADNRRSRCRRQLHAPSPRRAPRVSSWPRGHSPGGCNSPAARSASRLRQTRSRPDDCGAHSQRARGRCIGPHRGRSVRTT